VPLVRFGTPIFPHILFVLNTIGILNSCTATKEATEQLVCLGWMKLAKYSPIDLLRHINVVEQDSACESVVSILLKAVDNDGLLEVLSDPEARAFRAAIQDASWSLSVRDQAALTPERLFLSVAVIKCTISAREKDSRVSKLVPDVSVLCQVLELEAGKLIQAIEDRNTQTEDELVFICMQLLQLAAVADHEEGSRRLLATSLHRLLVSVLTPDDLIEEAVKAMQSVCRDDSGFVDEVAKITRELEILGEQNDGLTINYQLRGLSILSVLLELMALKQAGNPALTEFSGYVLPVATHRNPLIREAAVNCIGKLGLFMSIGTIQNEFEPLLVKIILDEEEKIEVRAQAMLGMADSSLLYEINTVFSGFISDALARTSCPKGLVYVAAEIAAKLLLVGKTDNQDWLAALLVLLFDPDTYSEEDEEVEEEDDVKQVGSSVRIHQMLTLFFPAYCLKHNSGSAVIGSVATVLYQVQQRQQELKKQKSRKRKGQKAPKGTWPIAKVMDYVVSTCENALANITHTLLQTESSSAGAADQHFAEVSKSSPAVLAAFQVASYAGKHLDELSATFRRALCKWLGSISVDCQTEAPKLLAQLKTVLDELEMSLDDASSSRSLSALLDLLADVSVDEDEEKESGASSSEEDEDDEFVDAFDKLELGPTKTDKENQMVDFSHSKKSSDAGESCRRSSLEPIN
jgi:hypothetical protein